MKFKKGREPANVFKFPEDAEKWAKERSIEFERSSALDIFSIPSQCFVDFKIGQAQMIVSYKVQDVTEKYGGNKAVGGESRRQSISACSLLQ